MKKSILLFWKEFWVCCIVIISMREAEGKPKATSSMSALSDECMPLICTDSSYDENGNETIPPGAVCLPHRWEKTKNFCTSATKIFEEEEQKNTSFSFPSIPNYAAIKEDNATSWWHKLSTRTSQKTNYFFKPDTGFVHAFEENAHREGDRLFHASKNMNLNLTEEQWSDFLKNTLTHLKEVMNHIERFNQFIEKTQGFIRLFQNILETLNEPENNGKNNWLDKISNVTKHLSDYFKQN